MEPFSRKILYRKVPFLETIKISTLFGVSDLKSRYQPKRHPTFFVPKVVISRDTS